MSCAWKYHDQDAQSATKSCGYIGLYAFLALCPYQRNRSIGEKKIKSTSSPCPLPFDFYVVLTLTKMAPVVIVKPFLLLLDLRCYDQYLYFAAFSLALGYLIDK